MNLYEQMEKHLSSPLDRQRMILAAISRLCSRLDADPDLAARDFLAVTNIASLKAAMDSHPTDTVSRIRAVSGALFALADRISADEVATKDQRQRMMAAYDMFNSPYEHVQQAAVLKLLDILCGALDTDRDVALSYRPFVFQET